jgi:hypothetical protein
VGGRQAYVNHVELVRKARGAEMPESFWHDPLMYQGGSDSFLAPARRSAWETKPGASTWRARSRSSSAMCRWALTSTPAARTIKLVMLVNDVGDMTEKTISFDEIGPGLYAFTAEGDPNTGVIIGDDSVMIVEAQATPVLRAR